MNRETEVQRMVQEIISGALTARQRTELDTVCIQFGEHALQFLDFRLAVLCLLWKEAQKKDLELYVVVTPNFLSFPFAMSQLEATAAKIGLPKDRLGLEEVLFPEEELQKILPLGKRIKGDPKKN